MTFAQINAAEELMKLAINNQSHVNSLQGYYRDLIDSFNLERAEWLINYDNVKVTAEDQYLLDKEIQSAQEELNLLQTELRKCRDGLAFERQNYFKLIENNGSTKKRLDETKKLYRELMNSCKPVGMKNKVINASKIQSSQDSSLTASELENKLININKSHLEDKRALKSQIDNLKDELRELISEHEDRSDECKSEYRKALGKLCDLERKNMMLTSEFFRFRSENSDE